MGKVSSNSSLYAQLKATEINDLIESIQNQWLDQNISSKMLQAKVSCNILKEANEGTCDFESILAKPENDKYTRFITTLQTSFVLIRPKCIEVLNDIYSRLAGTFMRFPSFIETIFVTS